MAKLSAHGTELFRLSRSKSTPESSVTTEEKITVSIRSDGAVLAKLDVKFKPDSIDPAGRWYSYGWKKKLGQTEASKYGVSAEKARDAYLKNGYMLCNDGVSRR